jgi:hypothetical protein
MIEGFQEAAVREGAVVMAAWWGLLWPWQTAGDAVIAGEVAP